MHSAWDYWCRGSFVRHWFAWICLLAFASGAGAIMLQSARSITVVAARATCQIGRSYVDDDKIRLLLDCDGISTSLGSGALVIQALNEHLTVVICTLYQDHSVDDCKFPKRS